MSTQKRIYNSQARKAKATQTRERILSSAMILFQKEGFDGVTIEKIAITSQVSMPTVYLLFKSKRGVLHAILDKALPKEHFESLVEQFMQEPSPVKKMEITAKLVKEMYDAERDQMNLFRGAAVLAPEFQELEVERERRRYKRQERAFKVIAKDKCLSKEISNKEARDILWAFTGRDMYRLFVIDRGWSSSNYEKWLAKLLIDTLLDLEE